jgi:hypothetical protein
MQSFLLHRGRACRNTEATISIASAAAVVIGSWLITKRRAASALRHALKCPTVQVAMGRCIRLRVRSVFHRP